MDENTVPVFGDEKACLTEQQKQVGHGQAEFNKQKHMRPAVPLAFPSSRVWLVSLSAQHWARE